MLLYITGGVGFLLSVLAILLIILFHKKDKSKIFPLIMYFLGFVLFMGSGFLHWKGFEFEVPFLNREPDAPLDMTGEWKQTNSGSEDAYQGIYISGNTIEVYWVTENGESTALYWAGSFTPPADSPKEYTWESENDTSRTDTALLASGDATKEFTYKNGKLSYSASAFGVTTTIEAEKGEWGYVTTNSPAPADTAEPEDPDQNAPSEPVIEPSETEPVVSPDTTTSSTSSGTLGDYFVEIKDAVIVNDQAGNPAIVITYAWTNNSEETTRADLIIGEKAFQDGVQMDPAIIGDESVYDVLLRTKEIRPGATIDVQRAYSMTSDSVIEFELGDLFGRLDSVVTKNFDPTQLN